jgi:multicomponent Na+:H+ antiporter subunit B
MRLVYEIPLLILLLVTAAGAILVKDLMSAILLLGCYSFFLSLVWASLGAVDVAFVEAVVGAGLATVLFCSPCLERLLKMDGFVARRRLWRH